MTTSTQHFHSPLPWWDEDDYAMIGAPELAATRKIRSSVVAPLVAQARGYRAVDSQDKDSYSDFLDSEFGKNASSRRAMHRIANNADFLFIPHYSAAAVQQRSDISRTGRPREVTRQFRPTNPEPGKGKYLFEVGSPTLLDVHPATPKSYFVKPATVLLTEGILKADAVLSAYLQHHGVSRADLSAVTDSDDPDAALHALMDGIAEEDRLLVVALAGVQNWRQNPEWHSMDFRPGPDRQTQAWVAFDGDLATNRDVWDATHKIMGYVADSKKVGEDNTFLLDLSKAPSVDGQKVGIDDFLARVGRFSDLPGLLTDELPARPEPPLEALVGQWRISESGTILQTCQPQTDTMPARWVNQLYIGGRLTSISNSRPPSTLEEATWRLGAGVNPEDINSQVEIEVAWLRGTETGRRDIDESTGEVVRATITGPALLMSLPPADWHKNGAQIPSEVMRHVDWPPRKHAAEWMRAVKSHEADRTREDHEWSTMGWVPTTVENAPAFIIGNQVIDADGESSRARPGIGERELSGATLLGVTPPDKRLDEVQRRELIKDSLETVFDRFLTNSPWKNSNIGKLMLAAALRPTVPLRPLSTLYFVGQAGSGKALPVDAEVPVPVSRKHPAGVARVGDLTVGDGVFGTDGEVTKIRSVTDAHTADVYEVMFSDGRSVLASDRHVWKVASRASSRTQDWAATRHRRQMPELSATLRILAGRTSGGESGRLDDIAGQFGLNRGLLERAVKAANVSSMPLLAPADASVRPERASAFDTQSVVDVLRHGLPEPVAVAGPTVAAHEIAAAVSLPVSDIVERLEAAGTHSRMRMHRKLTRHSIYPIGEVLLAAADLIDVNPAGQMTRQVSLTTEQLARRVKQGCYIDPIDVSAVAIRWTSNLHRQGVSEGYAAASGRRVRIGAAIRRGRSSDRATYLEGFISGARRFMDEAARKAGESAVFAVPDTEDRVIVVPDEATRVEIADLMRSLGRSPRTARDGSVLYSLTAEPLEIVGVRKLDAQTVKCITVEAHDGMFAAEGFVPTHNSWTAATALLFWQNGDHWNEDHLPGSAADTLAATEQALAMVPIWVVDDLAPSIDPRKAASDSDRIGQIIRSIYNNSGKRRSSADMTQREQRRPKALLIATAENELSVASVMDRTICVNLPKNSLHSDGVAAMRSLRTSDHASTVTAALIEHIASKVGFDEQALARPMTDVWNDRRVMLREGALQAAVSTFGVRPGDFERQAKLTSDLMLVIQPLSELAEDVGVDEAYLDILRPFGPGSMGDAIARMSFDSHRTTRDSNPGVALLKAIKWVLASNRMAYIGNAADPTQPPVIADGSTREADTRIMNSRLGWSYQAGEPRANGEQIGVALNREGKTILVISPEAAFRVAKSAYPANIPSGSTPRAGWRSVWDGGYAVEGAYGIGTRRRAGSGASTKRTSVEVQERGVKHSGVPVLLETLDSIDIGESFDDGEEPAE